MMEIEIREAIITIIVSITLTTTIKTITFKKNPADSFFREIVDLGIIASFYMKVR